jgi:hypothetical protein
VWNWDEVGVSLIDPEVLSERESETNKSVIVRGIQTYLACPLQVQNSDRDRSSRVVVNVEDTIVRCGRYDDSITRFDVLHCLSNRLDDANALMSKHPG